MSNVPSRAKRAVGVIGTSAAVAALGLSAAGSAQASPYATGWQCISPFANFTNNTFPSDPPAPNGIIDSLAINVARPGGDAIVATPGQRLPLHDVVLGLEIKDPRIVEQLYTRTGGVSINYSGRPLGQPAGTTTNRSMQRVAVTAATISPSTINAGGTAPVAGETWWAFTVNNQNASTPANANAGWYSDGTPNASGNFTRTYYTEPVVGSNPPQDYTGGYIAASASVGHKYVTHTGNNHFPINAWVTIEATNTVEKVQTVQAKGYWTVNVEDTTPGSLANPAGFADGGHTVTAPPVALDLPRSNWTPTGAGPVEFRVAAPGHSGPAIIESKGYDRAGYNRPVVTRPFGSVFVRADTEAYGASNDCVPGTIGIADSTIAASWWGNTRPNADASNPDTSIGSVDNPGFVLNNQGTAWNAVKGAAGRYSFAATTLPAFAAAPLAPAPKPPVVEKPKAPTAPKLVSGALKKSKSNTVTLKLTNPNATAVKYKITVRTVSSYKVGSGKSQKQSVVAGKTVNVGAGKTLSPSLKLSKAGKALLKSRKSIKVQVTATPTDSKLAKKVTKTVNLKR
ncbi:MAG: hypothetical protein WC558_12555 [Patulibacter sp.]